MARAAAAVSCVCALAIANQVYVAEGQESDPVSRPDHWLRASRVIVSTGGQVRAATTIFAQARGVSLALVPAAVPPGQVEGTSVAAAVGPSLGMRSFPLPFNGALGLEIDVPQDGRCSLVVYDVTGRRIATIIKRALRSGRHRVTWDGLSEAGTQVASGVYFAVLRFDGDAKVQKVVRISR